MKCQAQHGIACLPVTALHIIEHGEVTLALSNSGSSVVVQSVSDTRSKVRRRIFEAQNIHGITSALVEDDGRTATYHVIVWGGHLIHVCTLSFGTVDGSSESINLQPDIQGPRRVSDWIMTVVINTHEDSVVFLTAHNAVWAFDLSSGINTDSRPLVRGLSTLLYSGKILITATNQILIASGTIFGEVLFWICSKSDDLTAWCLWTKHTFLGHQGSIFGVAISDHISWQGQARRLLASCSDDRTIRIWDVSDYERDTNTSPGSLRELVKDTGFGIGSGQTQYLAMAWGHLSRIWGVHFVSTSPIGDTTNVQLVTRGEDAVCQLWNLTLNTIFDRSNGREGNLRAAVSDRHHTGKNAWALAMASRADTKTIYTGAADAQVISRQFLNPSDAFDCSIPFRQIFSGMSKTPSKALKQYLLFPEGNIIATTDFGDVVQTHVNNVDVWSIMDSAREKSTTTLCSNHALGLVFYSMSDLKVLAYDTNRNSRLDTECILPSQASWMQVIFSKRIRDTIIIYLLINFHDQQEPPRLLALTHSTTSIGSKVLHLYLPLDFVVTSAQYDHTHGLLFCGSRAGALAVFSELDFQTGTVNLSTCIRHVHGSDAVTSITLLPAQPGTVLQNDLHILTTGRDGTFAVHHIRVGNQKVGGLEIETIHRAAPNLGPCIEGAYLAETETGGYALHLYGFKSKEFILWNETHQTQLLAVECGGAHRNWSCSPMLNGVGTFIWTKAGTFNLYQKKQLGHRIVQYGGHGREIKAMATNHSGSRIIDRSEDFGPSTVLATGAEDTSIRLFSWSRASMSCIAILRHHTTGLQALKFSPCGRYLFSGGGVDEFVVWKLSKVAVVGVGAVVAGELAKTEDDEDARIMGIDVIEKSTTESDTHSFLVVMACSNGKAKIVEFLQDTLGSPGRLVPTQRLNIGTLCLTQAHFLSDDASVWILVGATDGFLRFSQMDVTEEAITSHPVHQSNIAAMAVRKLQTGAFLVVTGGDDNALGLTVVRKEKDHVVFRTTLVPKAHAAALTAVAIVAPNSRQTFVVTAGNDQKVRLWEVIYRMEAAYDDRTGNDATDPELQRDHIHLRRIAEHSTDVADISDLEVQSSEIEPGNLRIEALVVGVGMQTIIFEARAGREHEHKHIRA